MPEPEPPHDDEQDAVASGAADEGAGDPLFEALWRRVVDAWDDDKTHRALLEYAVRAEQLPEAAGRYRALSSDPEKAERAKRQMDAIVNTATQMMFAMKTPPLPGTPRSVTWAVAAVCAIVLTWIAYVIFHR